MQCFMSTNKGAVSFKASEAELKTIESVKTMAIAKITENVQNYGRLLTAHIDKENNVLYVMAERVLSADKMAEISKSLIRIENPKKY